MDPQRWRQVEQVYHAALEREPGDRTAFLAEACPQDGELRREVESLLAQHASRDGMLDHPVADLRSDSPTMHLERGSQLGPYRIDRMLGEGGMGEVYKARDTRLNRDVAIKVSHGRFSSRFEREALAVAALNHPNICTLYDVGPNYLVMELVEGPTLADRINQGAVPLDEALRIARQIADALEAAHEKGIVHRDLKPANIKIKPGGAVKVLDFGLATQSTDHDRDEPTVTMTAPGTVLGTAAYMSPEQARGKPVDKRADVWAFGAVLYEMLTGQRAFRGDSTADVLAAVVNTEPAWNRAPEKVQRLLQRCLEKDPERRLRHIVDFELMLENAGPPAGHPSRRTPWAAVAAILAILAAGLSWALWRETRPMEHPLIRLSVDLGSAAVAGLNTTVAISPDGTRIVFPTRAPDGKQQLATRLLSQTTATLLPGTENGRDAFFSPDGQWLGFFAGDQLRKISVQGGAPVTLCSAAIGQGGSWGEDGTIVATLGVVAGLSRVPSGGGAPLPITKLTVGDATHRWPQILPGGRAVLFTANPTPSGLDNARIEVVQLKTGERRVLLRGGYFGRYLPSGHLVYLHQGALFAVRFDLSRLQIRGTPAPVLEDAAANPNLGGGQFDSSTTPSAGGTFVYLAGKVANQAWPVVWLDGSGKTQTLVAAPGVYQSPQISPDGRRLALMVTSGSTYDIFVYDLQRQAMSRLTFTGDAKYPVWAPDGNHIAFQSGSTTGGQRISWIRADGAGEAQSLLVSRGSLTPSSFTSDGRRLAYFTLSPETGQDLWTIPLDLSGLEYPKPGTPEVFQRTPFNELLPVFSPDARWIAYRSDESGTNEIYVRPYPGPGGKWQISTGGGLYAFWSKNGRELFYETPGNQIMVADYTTDGGSFAAGRAHPWSDVQVLNTGVSNLALAPDGKRFAVFPLTETMGGEKGSVRVTFLLNFFDELRRKVPVGK
jgi:Tol biopolymer transport system component